MNEFFKKLSEHPHVEILNQPLDKTIPSYEKYKNDFKILQVVELQFRVGKEYQNTHDI